MTSRMLGAALVLGLLSAIGPFAIDMYLPALPGIQRGLHTDVDTAQMSLMAFFAAVAAAQVIYGPLSDMFGRKPPIYFGLCLFALASIGCALAPDIHTLIAARFVQGLGACAGMVIPRAIVRDMHTGNDAARLMALLMLVFSVSPILAPLTGSLVIAFGDWRAMFWVMTVVGVLGLLLLVFALRETRPREARLDSGLGSALRAYGTLLRDWRFLGLTLIGTFGMSSFMAFLGNSSFVYIDHYGLTPTQYSLAFSVNAVSFFAVSQMTGWLVGRFGLNRVVRVAVAGYTASMLTLFAVVMAGIDSVFVLGGFMFVAFGFLGLVLPSTGVLAMEEQGDIAGSASALMGTVQMIAASVVMGIVGAFGDGTARPMVIAFAACAILAFVITQLTLGARPRSPAEVPAE